MKKAGPLLAILIASLPLAGRATPQASVRLDFPPGYFTAKAAAPQKTSTRSQDGCAYHCTNFDEGYAWAGARKFTNEEQCRGRSRAFVEGCMTYVTERRRQNR